MWNEKTVGELVERQKEFFAKGRTLDVEWRIRQLNRLKKAILRNRKEMEQALHEDLGRSALEGFFCDVGSVVMEINETIKGLRRWAKPELHFSGLTCFPSFFTRVYKMPYGTTLIIIPFNFPFMLSLGVLNAAIAGGNTAVIKTSSKTGNCTEVLKKIIAEIFPDKYVAVVDGGHDVADICLAQRFDKIFYTGSPRVGKHVMSEAAKNLTPVALELGGETGNWCVVRKDANLKDAARKIAFFKALNSGQICININQVAVAEEVADKFVELLKKEFARQLGADPATNPEYPRLITEAAFRKCSDEALAYRDRIVYGGRGDEKTLKYAPTIIYPVDIDEDIVKHELFCPLLPIVTFKDDEVGALLGTIAKREHGLALYLFTKNMRWAKRVMSTQQYGGGCVNEVCVHIMVKGVPFNGTGHSGMGAYHGKWGFMEFTHPQTVLFGKTHFNLSLREHPYEGGIGSIKRKLVGLFEK
ncbi:MAG: aldehyde dehydrogenase family protein [Lachnospiraceae bacterium]|nr:aldehyde dehydrogenase family protein [Lachnospiraceae bacterium]